MKQEVKPEAARKVFIKTYGCQMNVYDSERMGDVLAAEGYAQTEDQADADLVILNTCHIRERAAEKVFSEVGKIVKANRLSEGKQARIAVAGCVAQAEGAEIIRRAPGVDMVFGPQSYHRLPELLARADRGEKSIIDTEFPAAEKFAKLPDAAKPQGVAPVSAFLTVQEGCDKFCSFCVVPYTRGAEYSRPVSEIEHELAKLTQRGVREVTLLGQNVNAWAGRGEDGRIWNFAELLAKLSTHEDVARIRYTTSHPRDMNEALIRAHAENEKLMPYLHLPVQSGSDRVLAAMNRQHNAQSYIDLIASIRAARPDIAISGDFIVGFPGETDAEFEETLKLVEEVGYAAAYSFAYSPRPGTPAAGKAEQVPEDVKKARLHRLQALLSQQMQAFNRNCVGRVLPVLLEKPGRNHGQLIGRSPYLQSVHLTADPALLGQIVPVLIEAVGPNSLSGHYQPDDSAPFHGGHRI
jgi:tRNA-2-methylthio-N6-dimethylallyladenosine synthase